MRRLVGGGYRKVKHAVFVVAWILLITLFGSTAASYAAPIPPLPDSGGIASKWVCTDHPAVVADPEASPPVAAEFAYSGCSVTEWEALPVPEAPAPGEPVDLTTVSTAIEDSSAQTRVVTLFGLGLLLFVSTALFFRASGSRS